MNAARDGSAGSIQPYWIPPHIRACVTPAGAFLLDLKRNRYFGVGPREIRSLCALASNWNEGSTQAGVTLEPMLAWEAERLADALVKAGLLSPVAPAESAFNVRPIKIDATLASVGHEVERLVQIRFQHILNFARACAWAKCAVTMRRLYSVAREVSRNKQRAPASNDVERTDELVWIFRRLRPYAFTAQDQCLFHALALLRFLSHYEVFPTWVIAVRARPWAAHSWLQLEHRVLDCNPEETCGFTPILSI